MRDLLVFAYADSRFSHEVAHFYVTVTTMVILGQLVKLTIQFLDRHIPHCGDSEWHP